MRGSEVAQERVQVRSAEDPQAASVVIGSCPATMGAGLPCHFAVPDSRMRGAT